MDDKIQNTNKDRFLKRFFFRFGVLKIMLASVLVLVVVAIIWGKSFIALASVIIDSFTDTSKVAETWQVEVDTGSGRIKLATRSCDSDVWICAASTTCVNDFGDGDYIIVASTTLGSTKQWETSATACDQPQCQQDGGQDGDQLVADNTVDFNFYPARDACKDIGGRLPTATELSCIYNNKVTFNNNFSTGNHWYNVEKDVSNARFTSFSTGASSYGLKTTSYYVRCVRGW